MVFYLISGAVASVIALRCYLRYFKWGRCDCPNIMKNKTVIITGANSGLGKEAAKELVKREAKVIMACRDVVKGQLAAEEIRQITGCDKDHLIVKRLDLSSLNSVKKFSDDIIKSQVEIDVLINNAAVCRCPLTKTADGFEMQFGVNHLGHVLLTNQLIKVIKDRIIFVTSSLYIYGNITDNFDKFLYSKLTEDGSYNAKQAYNDSKLAGILFARQVAKQTPADVLCVSPGMVWTNLGRHVKLNLIAKLLLLIAGIFFIRTPNEGVQSIIHCAVSDQCKNKTGKFYRNCKEINWANVALDDKVAESLWQMSEKFTEI